VLVLPDGQVIDESLEIMRWALGRNDPLGWLERTDEASIAANDGAFKHHLDRYKYPERYGSDPAEHRAAGLAILAALEARLAAARYLGGERPGLADAAIMPFVRQFAATDRGWFDARPLPALQAWLADWLETSLFVAAMVRLQPWKAGDAPVLFG
ncbi:MAG: glutathione S-transferase C-terminal domain-containing protein, partial [Novosphingobium sp.]